MKIVKLLILIVMGLLAACQKSNSPDPGNPQAGLLNTEELSWSSTQLLDLPNEPTVHVASKDGTAIVAMTDNQGKVVSSQISLESEKATVKDNLQINEDVLKNLRPQAQLITHFAKLKQRLINDHKKATSQCRSTSKSESVRGDSYENRKGAVLLKLEGAWTELFLGFEIAIALDPKNGEFLGFTSTKPILFTTLGFFSVSDEYILSGPKGHVVREYSPWISSCESAYQYLQGKKYKLNEQEKMDQDASALVDLDIRTGIFKDLFYEIDQITIEELKNEGKI